MFPDFTALVAFLAVVYAGLTKFVQTRLVNRGEMEDLQKESKRLSADFEKAKKANDKKKMDSIMKEQMDFLPKMNKAMLSQFKPMLVILAVFFAFTWSVGQLDPTTKDDIHLNLSDDGTGCDEKAGDMIHSACLQLPEGSSGKWMLTVKGYRGGSEIGHNSTYFIYNSNTTDTYAEGPAGEAMVPYTDKASYSEGDTARIYARSAADRVEAKLDSGTAFKVELPLAIPILNIKTINQSYWWFIFISLISNLSMTLILGRLNKAGAKT